MYGNSRNWRDDQYDEDRYNGRNTFEDRMSVNKKEMKTLAEFYSGKVIFITGASGFMGKVLLEKLLYSFPNLYSIYILLRPKGEKSAKKRLEEMISIPLFSRIREENPDLLKKIIALEGDVRKTDLGLSAQAKKELGERVSVVFHCAATLKLEANLKDAVEMNTLGTFNVLMLAKSLSKLRVFVHLSTAFCHVDQEVLEEKGYNCAYEPTDIIKLVDYMDSSILDKITLEMIAPHPNTYTFSKRLAEKLVMDEFPELPVCIARPSIVCPAFKEPLPGWVDNLNGPVGIMVAASKGVLRSMYCKKEYTAELIPVDFAINGLIAIAKTVGSQRSDSKISVFNMTQCNEKTVSWGELLEMGKKFIFELPFDIILWFPDGNIRSSLWAHKIYALFLHWIPAYFIDFMLLIFRQKRFMIRVQQKIAVGLEVLQYFTTHKWNFKNDSFLKVRDSMTPEDKIKFFMDFQAIDELSYLKDCITGARQYCLKEPLENLPKARKNIKIFYVVDRIVRFLFILFLAYLLVSWAGTARYVLDTAGEGLRNIPFVRSIVRSNDVQIHRQA